MEGERERRESEKGRERCIFVKVGNFDTKFCTFLSFDQNEIVLPPYTILLTFPQRNCTGMDSRDSQYLQEGRGHLNVNYTSIQSFINMLPHSLVLKLCYCKILFKAKGI